MLVVGKNRSILFQIVEKIKAHPTREDKKQSTPEN